MALPDAEEIDLQLAFFDLSIRRAIMKGVIFQYMNEKGAEIVSKNSLFNDIAKAEKSTERVLQGLQGSPRGVRRYV